MPSDGILTEMNDQLENLTGAPARASDDHAGRRILVVDDNIINCQVAVHTLMKMGWHAEAATSSRASIEMHAQQKYDLILMDCQMPELDGYQTAARIRSTESGHHRRTPIIGWTSESPAQVWEQCIAAGMDDLLAKPIRVKMAHDVLARWLCPKSSPPLVADAPEDNLEGAVQRFGAAFPELAALFRSDALRRLDVITNAAIEGNYTKMATVSHVLGGSCASIGATRMAELCRALESHCKAEVQENPNALIKRIQLEFDEIDRRICTLLQSATL
jgi:CheY-like chemotaxis protein